ncbi:MAG: magnesium and cobalt transport protein CorA, partial [Candidatus Aminicenantes bacterium]|nr:magnesium and cobalt transport protein CorA [Candidatus Aminicenantes bacterium]
MTADPIKRSEKAGLPPGTLMYVGSKAAAKLRITVIDYDESAFLEKEVASVEECFPFKDTATVTWINIDGVHDAGVIGELGAKFDIHPLILEDIMTTSQRPKVDDLGNAVFVVLRMIECDAGRLALGAVTGSGFGMTFNTTGDILVNGLVSGTGSTL